MSSPFFGEIRMFGGTFAPVGWAFCDGSVLPIAGNEDLFQLIGSTFGGDGQSNFALPDLRGRIPIHQGNGHLIGQLAGSEVVTLTAAQMPAHQHALASSSTATRDSPAGNVVGETGATLLYAGGAGASMAAGAVQTVGGSQPHNNMMPYLCVSFIISLGGIFPAQG